MRKLSSAVAGLTALLLVFAPSPALPDDAPQKQAFAVISQSPVAVVKFRALKLASARQDAKMHEIALRFTGPVDEGLFLKLQNVLPDWVEFSFSGYDSAVIRAKRAVDFQTRTEEDGFSLRMVPAPGADEGERRVDLQAARLAAAEGEDEKAREMLARLHRDAPEDTDVLVTAAGLEAARGNDALAYSLYDRAAAQRPGDQMLAEQRNEAGRAASSYLALRPSYQTVEDGDEQIGVLTDGRVTFGHGAVTFAAEYRRLKDDEIRHLDGTVGPVDDDHGRGELGLSYTEGGWTIEGAVLGSEETFGGRAALTYRTSALRLGLAGAYHEPYWDLPEGLAFGGERDRVALSTQQNFGNGFGGALGVSYNRYGVSDDDDVGSTAGVEASLSYFHDYDGLQLGLEYSLDAEYLQDIEERPDGFGGFFSPLPLGDREVHALSLSAGGRLTREMIASVYGGYAYDRYGADGPFGGIDLTFRPSDTFDLNLNASHSATTGRAGEDGAVTRVGVGIVVHFPPEGAP